MKITVTRKVGDLTITRTVKLERSRVSPDELREYIMAVEEPQTSKAVVLVA